MALINPQSLYSGAAQVLNNAPHLAFQARLLQQHYAKQEALDGYYRKLPLTINEKGVRDQDRPDIAKGMNSLKEYYIQNKDRLRNGDQAVAYNYEKMIREQQDLTGRSQAAGLTDTHVGKLKFNPNTMYMFQSPDVITQLDKHHLPVDDPNHEDFDLETFTAPPKPYDRTTYFKNFASLKGNDNKQIFRNPDGITQTEINNPTYDEPQKNYVMGIAADKYLHDPSFAKMINEDLGAADATNPLNEDFKSHYGHNIQTPIDLATAYTFNGLKPQPITQKVTVDRNALLNKQTNIAFSKMAKQDQYIRGRMRTAQSYREATIDYRADKSIEENAGTLNKVINTSFDAGTNKIKGTTVDHIKISGKEYKGKFIDVLNTVKDEYAIPEVTGKDGKVTKWKYPDGFYLTEDKKTFIPVFLGEKSEKGHYIDAKLSTPRDIQMYKIPLAKALLTKKDTGSEITDDDFTEDGSNKPPSMKTNRTEIHKVTKTKTVKGLPVF